MAPWAIPVGVVFLLLLAARKSHGSHEESHSDGTRSLPLQRMKPTKVHHGFFPSAGLVEVINDSSWKWDGKTWLHNGMPDYPAGMFLHGVPGGPLDGWIYDWHMQAWVEPGEGNKLHHKNFYPPAGAVAVKGDSSFIWDGAQWLKNGFPTFPQGKELVGVGLWQGWLYDWKEQAWIEPLLMHEQVMQPAGSTGVKRSSSPSVSQSAPSPAAPTSSINVISSTRMDTPIIRDDPKSSIKVISSTPLQTKDSPATKQSVASAIRELKQDPDPHPQKIANVASMAQSAGLHETASVLSTVAVQKAQDKNIPLTDTAPVSSIKVTSISPLSNAQRASEAQKLEQSVNTFAHAADAPAMTFEPEIISHTTPDAPAITFEPENIYHTLASPLDGISDEDWSHFAGLLEDPHNKVNDRWELGIFKIGARRLVDLGMAKDPRQVQRDGKSVWIADFIPPLSMQIFVNDEHLQYDTFVKEMQYLSRGIEERGTKGKIPLSIHGVSPTRSGLLAVAKLAGLQGLDSFMKDNGDWDKFPNTRDAFLKANGVF
jgi:hypothetical protein